MASKTQVNSAWDNPNTHILEVLTGGCVDDFECIDVDAITGADGVTFTSEYCFDKTGKRVLRANIKSGLPTRTTATLSGLASDMKALNSLHAAVRQSGADCLKDARIAVYCREDALGEADQLVGWYELNNFDPGTPSFPRLTNRDGNRAAGGVRITSTATFDGVIGTYDVGGITLQPYAFQLAGHVLVQLIQCGNGICNSGLDCRGNVISSRGECDRWLLTTNDGTDTYVFESTDGGVTYDEANPTIMTGVGTAIAANCDNVFTNQGAVYACGDTYRLQSTALTYNALGTGTAGEFTEVVAAVEGAMLYYNGANNRNGVMLYNSGQSLWTDSYTADTTTGTQRVIACEDGVVITAGDADGAVNGAMYHIYNGAMWQVGRYQDTGWTTTSDQILSVDILNGTITMVVSNGTNTRVIYSVDGGATWLVSDERTGIVANSQLYRPTPFITWRIADCSLWANHYGVCTCKWVQEKMVDPCFAQWGVCENNPSYLAYVYLP
jgi:hypothetical protein